MNRAIPTPSMLMLRIDALEARIRYLEAQVNSSGAAPHTWTGSPHWVLGRGGASAQGYGTNSPEGKGDNFCGK